MLTCRLLACRGNTLQSCRLLSEYQRFPHIRWGSDAGNGDGRDDGSSLSDWDVDVNGFVAYWNWTRGSVTRPFGIFRANADGTGFAPVDTDAGSTWRALRVDDVAVYYEHAGAIIRHLK